MNLFERDDLRIITLLQQLSLLRMEQMQPATDAVWVEWLANRAKEIIATLKEE